MANDIQPQPGILDIALYVGGASHLDGVSNVLKLSSNENPNGPSEAAIDTFRKISHELHLYPSSDHSSLRQAIGEQLAPAAPDPAPEADANAVQQDAAVASPEPETIALETPPPGGVSLAALRPQNRPTDLVPPEVAAAVDAGTEVAQEAVAESLRPSARPSDVTERAQAILAAAASSNSPGSTEVDTEEGETSSASAATKAPLSR